MLSLKMAIGLMSLLLLLVLPAVTAETAPKEKPGECPIFVKGPCDNCQSDFECPGDEKCCKVFQGLCKRCLPPVPFASCCFGNLTFEHGDLVQSYPTKCMQLYCNDGDIVPRYYDKPEDCGCCEFNDKMYQDGEKIHAICTDMTCRNGKWMTNGYLDECCSRCNLKNDPHITTFDGWYYHWHGKCNYSISQLDYGYDEEFGIYGKFRECNKKASCNDITTFKDNNNTVIQIIYNEGPVAWVNSNKYHVKNFVEVVHVGHGPHPVLAWRQGKCNMFLGSQGFLLKTCYNEVFVWAYPNLMNQVNGLCGHYDGYMPDDFTDRTGVQRPLSRRPYIFPQSWLTNDQKGDECDGPWIPSEHDNNDDVQDPCKADEHEHEKLNLMCTALFLEVRWEGHGPSKFILQVAIWSCISDICIMEQNGVSITVIEQWKIEMTIILQVNIEIEIHTTVGALPPSEDSENSEHSEDSEHSLCSEHGKCNNPTHFQANMQVQIEFGDRWH